MKYQEDVRSYYLKEFHYFDGTYNITFNIIDINFDKKTITVAITNTGRISVIEFDLKADKNNDLYFEFGCTLDKIKVDDFETITD